MDWDFRHLKIFLTVCDTMNFSRAAVDLGMTQSAVSRSIADLEDRLGVTLLARTTRSMGLTPAGSAFRESARGLAGHVDAITHKTRLIARGQGRDLRIALDPNIAHAALSRLFAALQADHPVARLQVISSDSRSQREAILTGDLHLGLMLGAFGGPGLVTRKLFSVPLVALAPPGAPCAPMTWQALCDHPLILGDLATSASFRQFLAAMAEPFGGLPVPRHEVSHPELACNLVRAGLGIALRAGSPEHDEGLQRRGFSPGQTTDLVVSLAWRRSDRNSAVEAFVTRACQFAESLSSGAPQPGNLVPT